MKKKIFKCGGCSEIINDSENKCPKCGVGLEDINDAASDFVSGSKDVKYKIKGIKLKDPNRDDIGLGIQTNISRALEGIERKYNIKVKDITVVLK